MDKHHSDDETVRSQRDRSAYGEGSNSPGARVNLGDVGEMDYPEHLHRLRQGLGTSRFDLVDKPDGLIWHIKPLKYTLGLGLPGAFLLLGAMFMHVLLGEFGNPFVTAEGQNYSGLIRMLAMLAGAMLVIIAWPIRKPLGWTLEEQEQYEDSKQWAANRRMKDDRE
ncbi:hypothetical protein KDL44_15250 [bacterium]|nr:hypothetical protein [bacterium]